MTAEDGLGQAFAAAGFETEETNPAHSNDLVVPDEPIRALFETIYERKSLAQSTNARSPRQR